MLKAALVQKILGQIRVPCIPAMLSVKKLVMWQIEQRAVGSSPPCLPRVGKGLPQSIRSLGDKSCVPLLHCRGERRSRPASHLATAQARRFPQQSRPQYRATGLRVPVCLWRAAGGAAAAQPCRRGGRHFHDRPICVTLSVCFAAMVLASALC